MNIQFGDYKITSDSLNITLIRIVKITKGDNAGKQYEKTLGYYSTLEDLLGGLVRHHIRTAEVDTLQDLQKDVEELSQFIKDFCKQLNVDLKKVKVNESGNQGRSTELQPGNQGGPRETTVEPSAEPNLI